MAEQPSAPAELAAPKKDKKKLIIIVIIALLAVVSLTIAGTWFVLQGSAEQGAKAEPVATAVVKKKAVYIELEPAFVVNFKNEKRQRYMQASLALMARDEDELSQLKVHMPALRNQLVMLFSSQELEELNTPVGLEMLKQRVTATVQELAIVETGKPVVEQVLFTNFVMQ